MNSPLNPGPENVGVCTVFQRWHEVNLNVEFFAHGNQQYIMKDRHKSNDVVVSHYMVNYNLI